MFTLDYIFDLQLVGSPASRTSPLTVQVSRSTRVPNALDPFSDTFRSIKEEEQPLLVGASATDEWSAQVPAVEEVDQ